MDNTNVTNSKERDDEWIKKYMKRQAELKEDYMRRWGAVLQCTRCFHVMPYQEGYTVQMCCGQEMVIEKQITGCTRIEGKIIKWVGRNLYKTNLSSGWVYEAKNCFIYSDKEANDLIERLRSQNPENTYVLLDAVLTISG